MSKQEMIANLESSRIFFQNSTSRLTEADSTYAPKEGMFTVSQHIGHTAQTIDWFMEPLISGNGFNMDFEGFEKRILDVKSLDSAMKWLNESYSSAIAIIESKDESMFAEPLPEGPVMGGCPKYSVIGAIIEHTSHHRGALTVYSRLLGKIPKMPYGEI